MPDWVQRILDEAERGDRRWSYAMLTERGVDAVAFDHGYDSSSSFHAALITTFGTNAAALREATPLAYRRLVTPLGPMLAMPEEAGVVLLELLDRPALTAELEELKVRCGYAAAPGDHAHLVTLERDLVEYFDGRR